jgi:GDSL-like Lipase/Acylhydrolase family
MPCCRGAHRSVASWAEFTRASADHECPQTQPGSAFKFRDSANIVCILARGRNSSAGAPAGVAVLLAVALLTLAGSGCGDVHRALAAPAAAVVKPAPKLGVDERLPLQAWWNVAKVTRSGDEVFQARMSPASSVGGDQSRYVQMTGLGFPFFGSHDGHSLAGPGVDQRWDSQDNEYEVSFRFTGSRLGLAVFSTGGTWKALVDGVAVGGGAPRSAGSSYAYHVLDLDFSDDGGARSRTITFELSGGAWLSSIGTGAASDRISPPARPRSSSPSVYWLGDSYVAGAGARYPGFDDLVHVAGRQAGLSNVTVDALGGTGYLKSNEAAKFPNYLARARLNLRPGRSSPDLIVVGGSINDDIYSVHQVQAAASALYAYLARALPKAKVVVVPFTDDYPVPSPVQHAIEGVLSAARSAPNVIGVLDLPAQVLAQRANEPMARLASTLESTTVPYHPSAAAHELYGQIIGQFLARVLRQHPLSGS